MVHFVGSHEHDGRLQEAADIRRGVLDELPQEFREEVEILRQAEAFEDNRPLPVTSTGLVDGPSVDARLAWRQEMDRQMRRLLQDTNFALDDRLKEVSKHELRVGHADRMYDWYGKHGMKQARKEREAPAHIRFNQEDPVMPGSLRRQPQHAPALEVPAVPGILRERSVGAASAGSEEAAVVAPPRPPSVPRTLLTDAGRSSMAKVSPKAKKAADKPPKPATPSFRRNNTGLWRI